MTKNELIELYQFWYQFQNSSPILVEFDEEAAIRYARGISNLCSANLKAGASKAEPQPLEYSDDDEDGAGMPLPVKTRSRKGQKQRHLYLLLMKKKSHLSGGMQRNAKLLQRR